MDRRASCHTRLSSLTVFQRWTRAETKILAQIWPISATSRMTSSRRPFSATQTHPESSYADKPGLSIWGSGMYNPVNSVSTFENELPGDTTYGANCVARLSARTTIPLRLNRLLSPHNSWDHGEIYGHYSSHDSWGNAEQNGLLSDPSVNGKLHSASPGCRGARLKFGPQRQVVRNLWVLRA